MEISQAKQSLLDYMLEDNSLSGLLEKCAEMLGSPLRFTIHSGADGFLTTEGYPYADVIHEQMIMKRKGINSEESFADHLRKFEKEYGMLPFMRESDNDLRLPRRLLCLVSVGGHSKGIITLPEYRFPLEETDQSLMALCARCIGLRMDQITQDKDAPSLRHGMYMLLAGRNASYKDIAGTMGLLAPPRNGAYRLLIIQPAEGDNNWDPGVLIGQIVRLLSTEWYSHIRYEATVLMYEACYTPDSCKQIKHLLDLENCCGCISPVFHNVMDAGEWRYRINRLPAFQHAMPGTLTHYKDWLDWGIFGETDLDADQLAAFLPGEILEMREWDKTHGTAYVATLSAFIHYYGKRKQTAAALKTHVNTVNYRLQKMEELFGLDLNAPETSYRMFFAIRLIEYIDQMALK